MTRDDAAVVVIGDGIIGRWLTTTLAAVGAQVTQLGPQLTAADDDPAVRHTPSTDSGGLIRTGSDPQWQNSFHRYLQLGSVVRRTGALMQGEATHPDDREQSQWWYRADAGWVDAPGALARLSRAAADAGADLVADSCVSIGRGERGGWIVHRRHGDPIRTGRVVICAGPSTARLARPHIALPVPRYRSISYALMKLDRGDPELRTCVINPVGGGWLRPTSEDRTVLCGAYDRTYRPAPARSGPCDDAETDRIISVVRRWWPAIARATLTGGRKSYDLAMPPASRIVADPGGTLYTVCGFDGGGFKIAPAVAEDVARRLLATGPGTV